MHGKLLQRLFSYYYKHQLILTLGLLLGAVWFIIAAINFPSSGFLTGWDNLHPEFDFSLNFKRAISGVWQHHQGLGHIGGHGYASTLPHALFLWLLSVFVPFNYLRAVFTLLMLGVGAIGAYRLISYLLYPVLKKESYWAAFTSGLFYMINFATVQQFYTQLEAFIIHFAGLPWLLYSVFLLLDSPSRKRLIVFLLLNFIFSTQGFIPPLFIAYLVIVFLILLFYLIEHRSLSVLKQVFLIFLVIFVANSYWLLPVLYFTLTSNQVFLNSYNNLLSTQTWTQTNNLYGTLSNLSILRGFPIQAIDQTSNALVYIFQPWRDHFDHSLIEYLGYLLFGLIIFGSLIFIYCKTKIEQKKKYQLALIICVFLYFSLLAAQVPVFTYLSKIMQNFPLFKQAFRTGFTKLSISLSLIYSIGIGFAVAGVYLYIKKYILIITSIISVAIIIFAFPVFTGNLLYQKLDSPIPKAYFEMFDFFKKENDNGRIMTLPQGDNWGWYYYKWGYTGSGFSWFGLAQPVLERAFDVWNNYNENYYWELSYAIYSQNQEMLASVIKKYNVKWVILDTSLLTYSNSRNVIYTDKTESVLRQIPFLSEEKTFYFNSSGDYLRIYKVDSSNPYISWQSDLPQDAKSYTWTGVDQAYADFGPYFALDSAPQLLSSDWFYYPFRSLFTNRENNIKEFQIKEEDGSISFLDSLPSLPDFNITMLQDETTISPIFHDGLIEVQVPKIKQDPSQPEIKRCDQINTGTFKYDSITSNLGVTYSLENQASSSCADMFFPNLYNRFGYLLRIDHKNIRGDVLTAIIINGNSQRDDLKVKLQNTDTKLADGFYRSYIIIPPTETDGIGYSLRLSNSSIIDETINEFRNIEIYQIPYQFLTSIKLTGKQSIQNNDITDTVVLDESFDSGWKAYEVNGKLAEVFPFIFGTEIKNHILVNNWKNGWTLDMKSQDHENTRTIIVFYLPQLLQYAGFVILVGGIIWVIRRK